LLIDIIYIKYARSSNNQIDEIMFVGMLSAPAKKFYKDILGYSLDIQRMKFHSFAAFGIETTFLR